MGPHRGRHRHHRHHRPRPGRARRHRLRRAARDGSHLRRRGLFGTVESVKAVSDLYTPVGGEVVEVNEALSDSPEKINEDPYGEGWIVKIQVSERPISSPPQTTNSSSKRKSPRTRKASREYDAGLTTPYPCRCVK